MQSPESSGRDAVERLDETEPDVAVIDIGLPYLDEISTTLSQRTPRVPLVAIGLSDADSDLLACAEKGIAGYVTRDSSVEELSEAIHSAANGELICSPRTAGNLVRRLAELAAAERILAWGQDRGYDVTLMLYPMMPITVDDEDRELVQKPFQEAMRALAEQRKVRFIDATFVHNVKNEDFLDFDHLSPEAHARFSKWLLEGELSFLVEGQRVAGGMLQ